jgi:multidrug efflux pump subunit AcrA (membrane-fusion protein)
LLATLEDGSLKSELAALTAQLSQAGQRHHAALSKGEAANAGIEALEVARLKQEIQQLNTKLLSTQICAPIGGVVVAGDLHGIKGASLGIGQHLFEIAPLDQMKLEVAIPEADILEATEARTATVLLSALPWQKTEAPVTRIHPRSEMRDEASVFIGEIVINNSDREIRPGMRGTARLGLGWKTAGWILLHKPLTTARQYLGW